MYSHSVIVILETKNSKYPVNFIFLGKIWTLIKYHMMSKGIKVRDIGLIFGFYYYNCSQNFI